jgi:glycosyltransferase involved in cell wall biosynthesis
MVFSNDHWEGLLGIAVGRLICSKKVILLRSSGMTEDHYGKYGCHQYDCIATIGDELHKRVQNWAPDRQIEKVYDGIRSCEFLDPKPRLLERPSRVLVIGSALDCKGWADLSEAARILQEEVNCSWKYDFTGNEPDRKKNDLHLARLRSGTCNFLGRQEGFRELVRSYDLVINPSRQETFGMAAIEVLAAGVPLLSTKTGVMGHVQSDSSMMVPPAQPRDMAEAIGYIWKNWETVDFNVSDCQRQIRKRFMTDSMANRWVEIFRKYGMQCAQS